MDLTQNALCALTCYETILGVPLSPYLCYPGLVQPLFGGLINDTFLLTIPDPQNTTYAVLQRVNPLFAMAVQQDIFAITQHLFRKGKKTPLLLPARSGELAVDLGKQGVWRVLSFIEGHSHARMEQQLAEPAGELIGSFHAAVSDLEHRFHFVRPGAHDFANHLHNLRLTAERFDRQKQPEVPSDFERLAFTLLAYADEYSASVPGPLRICHGDLKINNLRFDAQKQGICLLDLDTLAYLPLALEMGDALRSYCNPLGEDVSDTYFELRFLEGVLRGYAKHAAHFITQEERETLIHGMLRVSLQLAARFARDVVEQNYFRYDPHRFPNRAQHNMVRARGQFAFFKNLLVQKHLAEKIVRECFSVV